MPPLMTSHNAKILRISRVQNSFTSCKQIICTPLEMKVLRSCSSFAAKTLYFFSEMQAVSCETPMFRVATRILGPCDAAGAAAGSCQKSLLELAMARKKNCLSSQDDYRISLSLSPHSHAYLQTSDATTLKQHTLIKKHALTLNLPSNTSISGSRIAIRIRSIRSIASSAPGLSIIWFLLDLIF